MVEIFPDSMPIDQLELFVRTYNCLRFAGIKTVGHLVRTPERDLYRLANIGPVSVREIQDTLAKGGRELIVANIGIDEDELVKEWQQEAYRRGIKSMDTRVMLALRMAFRKLVEDHHKSLEAIFGA